MSKIPEWHLFTLAKVEMAKNSDVKFFGYWL